MAIPPNNSQPSMVALSNSMSIDDDIEEEDEEFRRAREMALAVAALGSGGGGNSSSVSAPMTALDIRMAVADVMCGDSSSASGRTSPKREQQSYYLFADQPQPEDDIMKLKKQLYAESKEKHVQQAKNEKLKRQMQERKRKQQEKLKQEQEAREQQQQQKNDNFVWYLLASVWNETLGQYLNPLLAQLSPYLSIVEGKTLQGPQLIVFALVMNGCLLYLSMSSKSSSTTTTTLMPLCNAIFVMNATFFLCLTGTTTTVQPSPTNQKQRDSITSATSETARTDEQKQKEKQQEKELLLVATRAAAAPKEESQVRLEWLEGIKFQEAHLQELEKLQPDSTLAERRRFLKARKHVVKAASAQLGTYLQWRQDNRVEEFFSNTFATDQQDWMAAGRGALEICNTSGNHVHHVQLPRLVSVFEDQPVLCKNGARVVHVLPCQLDSNLAAPSTYALAVAMYLDCKLNRNHTEKVTVVIDIRFGLGWTNPSSVSIVPFIKLVVGLLNTYFPERLSRCILFPLPRTATMLFNTAKTYLDPDTAAKIQVCSGAGSVKAKVPDKVYEFIDTKAISVMEERRKSFFKK